MGIRTSVETLTPKKAAEWLKTMGPNRPQSVIHAQRIAAAIKSGAFKFNGETIKFDDKGQMQDGQHRCTAVIMANTSIQVLVVRGLPSGNGLFESIDTGKKRTGADMLARSGEDSYVALAASAGWLWRLEKGYLPNNYIASPRPDELREVIDQNPGLRDSVAKLRNKCRKLLRPALAIMCHYMFSKINSDQADKFFGMLATGENISASSPETSAIYRLRSALEDDRASRAKLPPQAIIALIIKAWNAYRRKQVVKLLRWGSNEEFPKAE